MEMNCGLLYVIFGMVFAVISIFSTREYNKKYHPKEGIGYILARFIFVTFAWPLITAACFYSICDYEELKWD